MSSYEITGNLGSERLTLDPHEPFVSAHWWTQAFTEFHMVRTDY